MAYALESLITPAHKKSALAFEQTHLFLCILYTVIISSEMRKTQKTKNRKEKLKMRLLRAKGSFFEKEKASLSCILTR